MPMRPLLLLFAALPLPAISGAQQKISGVARDADTGTPLPCIDVWLAGPDSSWLQARTRSDGSFSLETTPRDSATLLFASWGVQPVEMPVSGLVNGVNHVAEYRLPIHVAVGFTPNTFSSKDSAQGSIPPAPIPPNSGPAWPRFSWLTDATHATVVMRYVVDSTGKVRDAPVEALIGARHAQYVNAIRTWLRRTKFSPGTYRGVPRCDMMTQSYEYFSQRER